MKPEIALPTVWQCPDERQWLCPLAGMRQGWWRHSRNNHPAFTRGEGVITAKCQTVGISKDRSHPDSCDIPSFPGHKKTTFLPSRWLSILSKNQGNVEGGAIWGRGLSAPPEVEPDLRQGSETVTDTQLGITARFAVTQNTVGTDIVSAAGGITNTLPAVVFFIQQVINSDIQ